MKRPLQNQLFVRDFLSNVKYDHLIAAIPSYSCVRAKQVNQLWAQRFHNFSALSFKPMAL